MVADLEHPSLRMELSVQPARGVARVIQRDVEIGIPHFDRAYVDEGAAMLLGLVVPDSTKPLIRIPKWLADHVMLVAGEGASAAAVEEVLKQAGLPSPFAHDVGVQIMEHFANAATNGIQSVISLALPRDFDIDNRFVELAVAAKKEAKTGNGLSGRGGSSNGLGGATGTSGSGGSGAVDAKIAALEARITALEREVAALKQSPGSGRPQPKGNPSETSLKPVDSGYESAIVEFRSTGGTTLTVKLNGKVIGTYDETANIQLDNLLAKGFENHLTFTFDKASQKVSTGITLKVRPAPEKPWIEIANFSPRGELEHTVDLPFKPQG